jgi:glycosyltransferase involved in cell wall biosynthesis
MTVQPLVTVYMPTKDRAHLLNKAVLSVLSQSYKKLELIIVSDGSTDNTEDVVNTFIKQDSRVRFFSHKISKGACASRNIAIANARGEYITGIDDDDEFLPSRIDLLIKTMLSDNVSFVCSGYYWKTKVKAKKLFCTKSYITHENILDINGASNQVLTRTESLRAIGGFDESLESFQDYDCWIRLISKFGSAYRILLPTYIVNVNNNIERISTNSKKRSAAFEIFYNKHIDEMSPRNRENQNFTRFLVNNEKISFFQLAKALKYGLFRMKIGYYIRQLKAEK